MEEIETTRKDFTITKEERNIKLRRLRKKLKGHNETEKERESKKAKETEWKRASRMQKSSTVKRIEIEAAKCRMREFRKNKSPNRLDIDRRGA